MSNLYITYEKKVRVPNTTQSCFYIGSPNWSMTKLNKTHRSRHSLLTFHKIIPLDILSKTQNGFLKWAVTKVMTSLHVTSNMDVCCHQRAAIDFFSS